MLIAAGASIFTPDAYDDLFGVALFAAIIVWMIILISHLELSPPARDAAAIAGAHAVLSRGCSMRAWSFWRRFSSPWDSTATFDVSWLYGVPWMALISLAYFVRRGSSGNRRDQVTGDGEG